MAKRNANHIAAVFELFLGALFHAHGYAYTVPTTAGNAGRAPDFDVHWEHSVLVEAKSIEDPAADVPAVADCRAEIHDYLNEKLDCPEFWIGIQFLDSPPGGRVRKSGLISFLRDLIERARRAEGAPARDTSRKLQEADFERDGLRIRASVIRRPAALVGEKDVRPIGFGAEEPRLVRGREAVSSALEAKRPSEYGVTDQIYVIALNCRGVGVDDEDLNDALYGQCVWTVSAGVDQLVPSHREDGFWIAAGRPTNTRVAAVLVASNVDAWELSRAKLSIYHNPWAASPCVGFLDRVQQVTVENEQLVRTGPVRSGELLGLSESWPVEP